MRRLLGPLLLVVAVAVAAACGSGSPGTSGAPTTPTTTAAPVPTSTSSLPPSSAPTASLKPVEPIGVDPTAPLAGACTKSAGTPVCPPDPAVIQQFVGLTEAQAAAQAAASGWPFRVAERDGERFLLTQDYNDQRVNVALQGGVVTRAWFG